MYTSEGGGEDTRIFPVILNLCRILDGDKRSVLLILWDKNPLMLIE